MQKVEGRFLRRGCRLSAAGVFGMTCVLDENGAEERG
jgi:hypothetical protein